MRRAVVALIGMALASAALAQTPAPQAFKLWPNGAPGSQAHRGQPERAQDWWVKNIHDPSVTAFPADAKHNSGAAIVILPGPAKPRVPTLRAALARHAIGNCHHFEPAGGDRRPLDATTGAEGR